MTAIRLPAAAESIRAAAWFKILTVVVICGASALLVYSMFSASLGSKWSFVDDQEIVYYLGSDHKISLAEAWDIYFNETEIGKFGSYQRFRPAYYAIRLFESWLFGDQLVRWYWTNLLIFAAFLATFWFLSAEKIGFIAAGLITFFIATSYYWIDVFARLGPSEPYAVLGLIMFALGVPALYRGWNLRLGWSLICLGTMIMIGSKENFFVILIPLAYIAFDHYRKHALGAWSWVWLAVTAAWCLWILAAIAVAVGGTGLDIYQHSVGISDKAAVFAAALQRWDVIALLGLCVTAWLAAYLTRTRDLRLSRLSIVLSASVSFLTIVYLTQFLIYGWDFPNQDRYDFPGFLVGPLCGVLLIWYFREITRLPEYKYYSRAVFAIALLACAWLAYSHVDGIRIARQESLRHVWRSYRWTRNVMRLESISQQYPDHTLIFQANQPIGDFMVALTYNPFLRYVGVSNPMSVIWIGGPPESFDGLSANFVRDLQIASLHGGAALQDVPLRPDFVPLSMADEQKCILVLISSGEPALGCPIVTVWEVK